MSPRRNRSDEVLSLTIGVMIVLSMPAAIGPALGGTSADGHVGYSHGTETSKHVRPALEATDNSTLSTKQQVLRNLLDSIDIEAGYHPDSLGMTTPFVKQGLEWQMARINRDDKPTQRTVDSLSYTSTASHDSPSAAALAILDKHGVTPTAKQASEIRSLDSLPEPTRTELTDVLDAYLRAP